MGVTMIDRVWTQPTGFVCPIADRSAISHLKATGKRHEPTPPVVPHEVAMGAGHGKDLTAIARPLR